MIKSHSISLHMIACLWLLCTCFSIHVRIAWTECNNSLESWGWRPQWRHLTSNTTRPREVKMHRWDICRYKHSLERFYKSQNSLYCVYKCLLEVRASHFFILYVWDLINQFKCGLIWFVKNQKMFRTASKIQLIDKKAFTLHEYHCMFLEYFLAVQLISTEFVCSLYNCWTHIPAATTEAK